MGGGKSVDTDTESSKTLSSIAKQLFAETTPARTSALGNLMDVLQTGGTMSKVPGVQSAVEQSKAQLSDILKNVDTEAAQTGTAGTPFAQGIKAETAQKGGAIIGQLPEQMRQQYAAMYYNLIPTLLGQGTSQASSMLGQAASSEAQMAQINAQNQNAFSNMLFGLGTSIGTASSAPWWLAAL